MILRCLLPVICGNSHQTIWIFLLKISVRPYGAQIDLKKVCFVNFFSVDADVVGSDSLCKKWKLGLQLYDAVFTDLSWRLTIKLKTDRKILGRYLAEGNRGAD